MGFDSPLPLQLTKDIMKLLPNNIDVNRCAAQAGNRFDLILMAAVRTRELNRGAKALIANSHKSTVTALEEIQ